MSLLGAHETRSAVMEGALGWEAIAAGVALITAEVRAIFWYAGRHYRALERALQRRGDFFQTKSLTQERQLDRQTEQITKLSSLLDRARSESSPNDIVAKVLHHLNDPSRSLWKFRPDLKRPQMPEAFRSGGKKIITVINFKGGVGKTTLALNLGAHFSKKKNLRVLFVDMDYQGSMTYTLRSARLSAEVQNTNSDARRQITNPELPPGFWLNDDVTPDVVADKLFNVSSLFADSALIETDYDFVNEENSAFLRWVLHDTEVDVRFRLAELLWSDEFQRRFDITIIDAPPRLSTGAINAMCASTHYIVPTNMDLLASEPVALMLEQMKLLFDGLADPEFLGVVASRTRWSARLDTFEEDIRNRLEEQLQENGYSGAFFAHHVPRIQKITKHAGRTVAYLKEQSVRNIFDPLGDEVDSRIKAVRREHSPSVESVRELEDA